MPSSQPYSAPLSGQILGALVKGLQIRGAALSTKSAQRYFGGQRIGDDKRWEIFEAVGEVLVETGFIPRLPFLERQGFPVPKVVSTAIAWYGDQWDGLAGYMRATSAPVDRPDLAALSFLRLAVIDLALRVSAVLWLAELLTPTEDTPLWAMEKGGARHLRQLLDMCGEDRPTRDQFAERLGVDYDTVDKWLDTSTKPSLANIDSIAKALAGLIPDSTFGAMRSTLHRHYTLAALCDLLAERLGRDAVIDLAAALVRFTSRNLAGIRLHSKLPPDEGAKMQFFLMLLGVRFVATEHLLTELWRQEMDPVWATDLAAAFKPWHLRLQHIAQQLGGLDKVIQVVHDEYGIPKEIAEKLMDEALQHVGRDPTRFHITDPSDLEGKTFVRVKGDAKFSARNRMIQYAQAKAEGDLQTAITHVRRAVQLQPESADYHFHLGATLGVAGEVEEGIQECWIAAQLDPADELPRVEIGIILLNAGRNQEARDHLEMMGQGQGPLSAHLAFNLGVARLRCKDPAAALEALERAIESKPDHGPALDVAAHCAFLVGDKVKGRRLAKQAHRLGQSETYREWKEGKYRD